MQQKLIVLLLLAVGTSSCFWRQSMRRYERFFLDEPVAADAAGVRATFLGVSTILLTDGHNSVLVDGFFTRPSLIETDPVGLAEVSPSPEAVSAALAKAGVTTLDAVLVTHSHFDHAMDAPEVAKQTGAVVLGSKTTHYICRGWDLPDEQFRTMEHGDSASFGDFTVTFVRSRHAPLLRLSSLSSVGEVEEPEELDEPFVPPRRFDSYPEGGSYDIHISHPLGAVLVHPSAGYINGALDGYRADVIFLGISRLGDHAPMYRRAYYRETVSATGARLVIPVHWDDYTEPLDEPLQPHVRFMSDFRDAMNFLVDETEENPSVQLRMMQGFETILLFPRRSPGADT